MEHLDGESLATRLKWGGGRLGMVTLHFARQIASALAAAHSKGVVHCDLKPTNVMVVADPEMPGGERVKVLDFGIARFTSDQGSDEGRAAGTPLFMSPEQCGGTEMIDGKTDVYALGILLYQLVTGRPPFTGRNALEILQHHRSTPVPSLTDVEPTVPVELSRLIETMLAKDPLLRPSMLEVAVQLESLSAFPSIPVPVSRRIRRRKWAVHLALFAAMCVTVAGMVSIVRSMSVSSMIWVTILIAAVSIGWLVVRPAETAISVVLSHNRMRGSR
jgi:serine/threonine-protein kinase